MRFMQLAAGAVLTVTLAGVPGVAGATVSRPPTCADGQVAVTAGRFVQTMGQYAQTIILTNRSSHACALSGYPSLRMPGVVRHAAGLIFLDPPHAVVVLAGRHVGSFTFGGDAVTAEGAACATVASVSVVLLHERPRSVAVTVPDCGVVSVGRIVAGSHGSIS